MFKSSIPSAHNPQLMHSRQANKSVKDVSLRLSTVHMMFVRRTQATAARAKVTRAAASKITVSRWVIDHNGTSVRIFKGAFATPECECESGYEHENKAHKHHNKIYYEYRVKLNYGNYKLQKSTGRTLVLDKSRTTSTCSICRTAE